jgi:hypothetical protein
VLVSDQHVLCTFELARGLTVVYANNGLDRTIALKRLSHATAPITGNTGYKNACRSVSAHLNKAFDFSNNFTLIDRKETLDVSGK